MSYLLLSKNKLLIKVFGNSDIKYKQQNIYFIYDYLKAKKMLIYLYYKT